MTGNFFIRSNTPRTYWAGTHGGGGKFVTHFVCSYLWSSLMLMMYLQWLTFLF